jgi:transposase
MGRAALRSSQKQTKNISYSMREIAKKLKISYNAVYYCLHRTVQTGPNQNRKRSGRPRCTNASTCPQLAASLNSICKTPVSTPTVKRLLWDDGLLF